ncbi:Fe-S cluster assembly sulfur transfer protein SufU [Liquorilactobacillus capillatus]|uniref:NIF system FeS cluster assembly NifU N-terminal domain-containing protein n=1 Tax=Liquorilactobacillus capillatus DSM 19910 TaxID=1423731 RepID=A0A0R1M9A3_9LACO|nr:SUF system NifU family Fe-S cluster assembly protein [Liquorilactobacillus capillatus]KRL00120.1 hypothetical protein FC81_GL000497 [Liquorilactobacillus capillatus DSM 19910]
MALSKLENLYRQMILEHAAHPHHHGSLKKTSQKIELRNPTCGDVLTLEVELKDGKVADIAFAGSGCTISQASASMMTDEVIGKTPAQIAKMVVAFSEMVTGKETDETEELLGDATILAGVAQFPARIKCATLAWKAVYQAVKADDSKATLGLLHHDV